MMAPEMTHTIFHSRSECTDRLMKAESSSRTLHMRPVIAQTCLQKRGAANFYDHDSSERFNFDPRSTKNEKH